MMQHERTEMVDNPDKETNVHRIEIEDREIILVGTAHVSKESANEVRDIIHSEKPDTVCVELCEARYKSLKESDKWRETDIIKVVKDKKALLLLASLLLSSYQKRLAKQFDVQPGQEMIQGIQSAEEIGAELILADRDLKTTFTRIWRGVGFWSKFKLFFVILLSALSNEEISEEELEKLKSQDMLSAALEELSKAFPKLKTFLIDERDQYLAEKIRQAPGKKIVAVLGAGHIPGVKEELNTDHSLAELEAVPPKGNTGKIVGWSLAAAIVALIVITLSVDTAAGFDQILSWILWNGSLAAVGAIIALGHPLSVLTAFLVSPVSSLSPLLAAGWFAGLVEAVVRKPAVKDFERLSDDVYTFKGFWKNRVTRVLLVVALANVGSTVGSLIGGAEVIRVFLRTVFG